MQWRKLKSDDEMRRNTLTIRWTDDEHRLVSETAYERRTSCSEMIRGIVLGELNGKQDASAEQGCL